MKSFQLAVFLLFCLAAVQTAFAQQDSVTVPDVTGLNVPQAAAALNRAGLRLGTELTQPWSESSGLPHNTVAFQSIPAGQLSPFGTIVDITLLRSPNSVLIYDDNDITLLNRAGEPLKLAGLVFSSVGGQFPTSFSATRWEAEQLDDGRCAQFWSVGRSASKDVPECGPSIMWKWNTNPSDHFWTGGNGATQFNVVQDGVLRATCAIAFPGRCEFFLASSATPEVTEYVYIAYTPDAWIIFNNTSDRWMFLEGIFFSTSISTPGNQMPEAIVATSPDTVLGNTLHLAPNQCLYVTDRSATQLADLPVPCDIVAHFAFDNYWSAPLFVTSATDGRQRTCPAATAGHLTLCILPR